jgi:hypothetical protein
MTLPARDEAFLVDRGWRWELLPDPAGGGYLVVSNFAVGGGGFTPPSTDLMVRIPPQYPLTALDMWYCNPPLRIASTGQFAQATEQMESHLGKSWQRFSRHLNGSWKPGLDSLRSFFVFIQRELQGLGKQ